MPRRDSSRFGTRFCTRDSGIRSFHSEPCSARHDIHARLVAVLAPSRLAAAQALHGVFGRGRRVAEGWDAGLSAEDAALARAMLAAALRRWGRLQAWAAPQLKDPQRGLPLGTQVALALGLVQLAWLQGVAAHAAVHEAVELAGDRKLGFPPHRGLVNALLRRASTDRGRLLRELEDLPAALDRSPFAERVLDAACGAQGPRREALWARLQAPPKPSFRLLHGDVPEFLEADPELDGCLRLRAGEAFPSAWLARGDGLVQDRSSQALMGFRFVGQPRRILDVCAAPGGKTAALAQRFPVAELVALERELQRVERLRDNLARWGLAAKVVPAEAVAWLQQEGPGYDLILLDAPCSGAGTLGKHPELAWLGDRLDLGRLVVQQRRLLEAALDRLAPGGMLVYAVCSWLPEEGEGHLQAALGRLPDLQAVQPWDARYLRGSLFRPDPERWDGEGFQAFAVQRD